MPTEFEPLAAGQYTYTLYEHYDENGYLLEVGSNPSNFRLISGSMCFPASGFRQAARPRT